jgi:anaerobic selenocysteine-containing dehydrogenase
MQVLIAEDRIDHAFVRDWTHGYAQLAERVRDWTPQRASAVSGVPAGQILAAALAYAEGPASFVSGHGIDAVTNGVQTFRAFHCLRIAGPDRAGGNRRAAPRGRTYLDLDPRPGLPVAAGSRAGRWARQSTCCGPVRRAGRPPATTHGDRGHPHRRPYPVRAMYVRREHRRDHLDTRAPRALRRWPRWQRIR